MELIRPAKLMNIEIKYSEQAMTVISQLKNFDMNAFEKEYLKQIQIGDRSIWEYILQNRTVK